MRSGHSPYPQANSDEFNKHIGALQAFKDQYAEANGRLQSGFAAQIVPLLRHHTARRLQAKNAVSDLKLELKRTYQDMITAIDRAWADTMADIEVQRAEFHSQQALENQRKRREKDEYASLVVDSANDRYYYMKYVEIKDAEGRITVERRRTNILSDHPWVKQALGKG